MVICRMEKTMKLHTPVLLNEVIKYLAIKSSGTYVDATFGRGGHSTKIIELLGRKGRLIAFDRDPEAIASAKKQLGADSRFKIFHASFSKLEECIKAENLVGKLDGILLDLGVSSPQLEDPERGFSFMREGKLDMRMDTTRGEDAAQWLSKISEEDLTNVLWQYGEERYARRVARFITVAKKEAPIETTQQLAAIIARAVPSRNKGKNPATRSFQAIRIAVNGEIDELKLALDQAYKLLKKGGRLLVISFHSLEDRIVKQYIHNKERSGGDIPARLPIKHRKMSPLMRRVGRAVKPSAEEIASNPRARSAVLRIAEKLL